MTERDITGSIGEHLVAVDLIKRGYRVSFASAGYPYDLIADINGKLFKVQVKASKQPRKGIDHYIFSVNGSSGFDLIAFIALDINCIGYLTYKKSPRKKARFQKPNTIQKLRRSVLDLDQNTFEKALNDLIEIT